MILWLSGLSLLKLLAAQSVVYVDDYNQHPQNSYYGQSHYGPLPYENPAYAVDPYGSAPVNPYGPASVNPYGPSAIDPYGPVVYDGQPAPVNPYGPAVYGGQDIIYNSGPTHQLIPNTPYGGPNIIYDPSVVPIIPGQGGIITPVIPPGYGPPVVQPITPPVVQPLNPPVVPSYIPNDGVPNPDTELIPDQTEETDKDQSPQKPIDPKKHDGKKLYPEAEYYNHLADIIRNRNASINITFSGSIVRHSPHKPTELSNTKNLDQKPIKIVNDPRVHISIVQDPKSHKVDYDYETNAKRTDLQPAKIYDQQETVRNYQPGIQQINPKQKQNDLKIDNHNDHSEVRISVIRRPGIRQPSNEKANLQNQRSEFKSSKYRSSSSEDQYTRSMPPPQQSRGHVNLHENEYNHRIENDRKFEYFDHATTEKSLPTHNNKNDSITVTANIKFNQNHHNYINFTDIVYAKNGSHHDQDAVAKELLPPYGEDEIDHVKYEYNHRGDLHPPGSIYHKQQPDEFYHKIPNKSYIPPLSANDKLDDKSIEEKYDTGKSDDFSEISLKIKHKKNAEYVTPVPEGFAHLRAGIPTV